MSENTEFWADNLIETSGELTKFASSYASFNRIVNGLQRKYIELKEETASQNQQLTETNRQLIDMTARNLAVSEFLDSILGSISAAVIAVDRSGRITHFNPAASALMGMSHNRALGELYRDLIPPGEPSDANALRVAETGQAVEAVERKIELSDGTRLVVSVSSSELRDREGQVVGAVEVLHDLTKLKRLEQEVARLKTLAALGEMAASVAHQVRNPLSGILGYGSLLKRGLEPDDPRNKLVNKIIDGVETLNNTVSTLLNYTQNDEVNCMSIDADEYIVDTIVHFKRECVTVAENIELKLLKEDSPQLQPGKVSIDPVLFRQVLFNLFTNSCEACQPEGTITIQARRLPRLSALERYADRVLLALDETITEISIEDSGTGLPEEIMQKLFAPFFTTKDDGNGLGLAVAWKLMRAHGGEIIAENRDDGGARFTLALPVKIGRSSFVAAESDVSMEKNE